MNNKTVSPILVLLIQAILAVILLIFGRKAGFMVGVLLLYYLITIIFMGLLGESLCRKFGSNWGTIIASAPLWLPIVLLLTDKLWMPIFGIH